MPDCPRCHQPVKTQAITCPHCHTVLKAYGHPGIPLHQATDGTYLCATCLYHADDSCTYPQRPLARECLLYTSSLALDVPKSRPMPTLRFKTWLSRYGVVLAVVGLVLLSILLALQ